MTTLTFIYEQRAALARKFGIADPMALTEADIMRRLPRSDVPDTTGITKSVHYEVAEEDLKAQRHEYAAQLLR